MRREKEGLAWKKLEGHESWLCVGTKTFPASGQLIAKSRLHMSREKTVEKCLQEEFG